MDAEKIEQMLTELGPLIPRVQVIEQSEDTKWLVAIGDDDGKNLCTVYLTLIPYEQKLVLSSEIGHVPAETKAETCYFMMNFSALWQTTGGLRVTMDNHDDLELVADIVAARLDSQTLGQMLEAFANRTLILANIVAGGGISDSKTTEGDISAAFDATMIRV